MKLYRLLLSICFLLFSVTSFSQVVITMEQDGGVYKVPCKVNGLKLKFIFDTGASSVCISSAIANMMLENDYLSSSDILGAGKSIVADGSIVDHTRIILREIEIAGMKLKDVEAVVIHDQSAPLLLGQSAIQKLGRVSISGNKLTINSAKSQSSEKREYSEEDINKICSFANSLYDEGQYLLAVEQYDKLYQNDALPPVFYMSYARCLMTSQVNRGEDALDVLMNNAELIKSYTDAADYYLLVSIVAYITKDYDLSINYGNRCMYLSVFPISKYADAVYWVAQSNLKKGNTYIAQKTITSFIDRYLSFMEIKATDCWRKKYRDALLGDAYYWLALLPDTYLEGKKYYIIAAAWGNKESIENCKRFYWEYDKQPYEYEY